MDFYTPETQTNPAAELPGQRIAAVIAVVLAVACSQPADDDLDLLRGRTALQLAEPSWARLYFARDLETHPGRIESLRGLAIASATGPEASLSVAAGHLERYLEIQPDDPEARLVLARVQLLRGQTAAARRALGEPTDPEASLLLARSWLDEDPARSLEVARGALEDSEASAPHFVPLALLAARAALRLGEAESALAWSNAASEQDPLRARAAFLKARSLQELGRHGEAELAFERHRQLRWLVSAGPGAIEETLELLTRLEHGAGPPDGHRQARFELARYRRLLAAGRPRPAQRSLERLDALPLTADQAFEIAERARRAGLGPWSDTFYRRALELDPRHLAAGTHLARRLLASGDLDSAAQQLQAVLDQEPDFGPARHVAGQLARSQGDTARARSELARSVDLAPWIVAHRLTFADLLLTSGERQAALELLDAAPAPDPALAAFKQRRSLP